MKKINTLLNKNLNFFETTVFSLGFLLLLGVFVFKDSTTLNQYSKNHIEKATAVEFVKGMIAKSPLSANSYDENGCLIPPNAKVKWNANPESNIAGYIVEWGTSSGSYSASITVSGTTATLTGLEEYTQYFVTVKAMNTAGETSEPSAELSFVTGGCASSNNLTATLSSSEYEDVTIPPTEYENTTGGDDDDPTDNLPKVKGKCPAGYEFKVLYSIDMVTWLMLPNMPPYSINPDGSVTYSMQQILDLLYPPPATKPANFFIKGTCVPSGFGESSMNTTNGFLSSQSDIYEVEKAVLSSDTRTLAETIIDTGTPKIVNFGLPFEGIQPGYAKQFTVTEQTTIDDIEVMVGAYFPGNHSFTMVIYKDNNNLPDKSKELYKKRVSFYTQENRTLSWASAKNTNWVIEPGTYWIAFETRSNDLSKGLTLPGVKAGGLGAKLKGKINENPSYISHSPSRIVKMYKVPTPPVVTTRPTVTVSKLGTGIGSIAGITGTSQSFPKGTVVKLIATPSISSTFTSWTGCTLSSGNTCTIILNSDTNITATFDRKVTELEKVQVNLLKKGTGTGTIIGLVGTPIKGTTVVITAVPSDDSTFTSWTGCSSAIGNKCTLILNSNQTAIATFTKKPLQVSCAVSDTTVAPKSTVKITTTISNATKPYSISWSGTGTKLAGFDKTKENQTLKTKSTGTYNLSVTVKDSSDKSVKATCSPIKVKTTYNVVAYETKDEVKKKLFSGVFSSGESTQRSLVLDTGEHNATTNLFQTSIPAYATKFSVNETTTLDSVELFLKAYNSSHIGINGARIFTVVLYKDASGLPDKTQELYTKRQNFRLENTDPYWQATSDLNWVIEPGTYWIAFETRTYGVSSDANDKTTGVALPGTTGETTESFAKMTGSTGVYSIQTTARGVRIYKISPITEIQHTINTVLAGTGTGAVTKTVNGVPTDETTFNEGTTLVFTATPANNSLLSSWTGCTPTAENTCTLILNSDTTVTANFNLETLQSNDRVRVINNNVNVRTVGRIAGNTPLGQQTIGSEGTIVGDSETTNEGVAGAPIIWWNINYDSGDDGWSGQDNLLKIGHLNIQNFTLTAAKNGAGSITNNSIEFSSQSFQEGSTIQLVATPGANYTFSSWSECTSVSGNTCTVILNSNTTVTANFSVIRHTLNTSVIGQGTISNNTSPYNHGATASLTATPSAGYTFTGWSSPCSGTGTCTITMDDAKSVTATFTLNTSNTFLPPTITTPSALNTELPSNTDNITINWDSVSGANRYYVRVEEYTDSTKTTTTTRRRVGNSQDVMYVYLNNYAPTSLSNLDLDPGRYYRFWVHSYNSSDPNNYSLHTERTFNVLSEGTTDSDDDGVLNGVDRCPDTPLALKSLVNKKGCIKPKMDNFDIKKNLDDDDLSAVSNFEVGKTGVAKIMFNQTLDLSGTAQINLDSLILIENKKVTVRSDLAPQLNKPATITLYNITKAPAGIKKNGVKMNIPYVYNAQAQTLTFTVTEFSTYELDESESVITHTLTTTKSGSGTVLMNGVEASTGDFAEDQIVSVTATPAAGSTFDGWSGACTGTGSCSVSMTGDKSVTATFKTSGGGGGGSRRDRGGSSTTKPKAGAFQALCTVSDTTVGPGSTVSLDITVKNAASAYTIKWSGATSKLKGFDKTKEDQTFTLPKTKGTYTLTFEAKDKNNKKAKIKCPAIKVDPKYGAATTTTVKTQTTTTNTRTNATPSTSLILTKTLSPGQTDAQVKILQQILNAKGFLIATKGLGSKGNESTYYGELTKQAVKRFQQANNLPVDGWVGERTKALLNK